MLHFKKLSGTLAVFALIAVASAASYQFLNRAPEGPIRESETRISRLGPDQANGPRRNNINALQFSYSDTYNQGDGNMVPATTTKPGFRGGMGTFIVVYKEKPLATYKGGNIGLPMPSKRMAANGKLRLDTKSTEARSYVGYLQQRQRKLEQQMSGMVGRTLAVRQRMQHAINAVVVDMTSDEAERVRKMSDVMLVEAYHEYKMDTDTGPALIGAPLIWNGMNPGRYKGEGMVVGMIDSGINFGSPSFAGTDPVDSYVHINPLGANTYLGTCITGGDDAGRCNGKLIGGYDFVCGAPGNQCGVTSVLEEPGFGDTNGHGSHTASTAAGNTRDVVFSGSPRRISGVAPRANIIAYDVCYTNTSTNQGLCPNASTLAAVNQAVADGVVDVINYSISGGTEPWTEAVSLAFLSAADAGIYVATSAGNSGPGPNTVAHLEPWLSATASAQHGRGGFGLLMQVTGPAPVPAALAPLTLNQGTGGIDLTATISGTTPLLISSGISTTSDGCTAYPANTFIGAIAVIRRGTCSFSIKTNNAAAAGAIAVVIANNQAGVILPSVPGTTIPVFSVTQADGDALRNFGQANPTSATAQVSFPAVGLPNTPDVLAASSSRGPASRFNLIKPDVTAPGVSVLAVTAGATVTGFEQSIGLLSGTSMASPHNAGSAMLIRQARPAWTVAEVKSALAMTATTQVFTEDEITPANPFARGSGRIRVDRAINAGLLLNETTANFTAANPDTGGNTAALNLASLANGSCTVPTCTFTRTFRNPGTSGGLWWISINGLTGTSSTALAWILPGASRTLSFTINTSTLPANGSFNFGEVLMQKRVSGGLIDDKATLRLPIAIAVLPPKISLPSTISGSVVAGNNGSTSFSIGNIGGSPLNYTVSNTGNALGDTYSALRGAVNSGFRNTIYSDPATAGNAAQFSSDDFDVLLSTQITSLSAEAFVVSGAAFPGAATNLTWSIYPDAAGFPAGNPQSNPAAAVWTYTAAPTATGVSTTGGIIALNLTAAGQNIVLPPGKYWLVVNTSGTFANRWAQFGSATGNGSFASISVSTSGAGTWTNNTAFAGLNMVIKGSVACGAPWLGSITPATGVLLPAATQSTSVVLNSASLTAATYRANICVNSNDPANPTVAVPVTLTVTP
jgi:hypothetical protein